MNQLQKQILTTLDGASNNNGSKLECNGCSNPATHILVDKYHKIIGEGEVYCKRHAFENSREECPYCFDRKIEHEDKSGEIIYLLPTYPEDALDDDGGCSDHP